MDTTTINAERRRDLLSQQVQREVAAGGRVESRGDYDAVIVRGQRVNHVLHLILSVLTLGLWLIVWVLLAITGGEKRSVITVDEFGRTNVTGRSSVGFTPIMLVPLGILILWAIVIAQR